MIDIESVQETKKNIREAVLSDRLKFMTASEGQAAQKSLIDKILHISEFRMAQNVMAYASQDNEVPLYEFMAAAQKSGKAVYLPGRGKKERSMEAFRLPKISEMPPPPWGLWWEEGKKISPAELDFIIVPGVAFSLQGDRLGTGGGYYDRFLPRAKNAYFLAVALECQLKDTLPTEPHDVKVHAILTEKRFIEV